MALVLNDRVKETSTTTGTGVFTLAGVVTGFETFSAGVGNSNTTYYGIFNGGTAEWEVGLGTLNVDSTTLTRTTVISSSNSDTAVNFTSGTKDVFCTLPAIKTMDMVLTTSGDVPYASANNTPARLAKGTARQVLQINSGASAPEWSASPQSILTATSDLLYASSANTLAKLAKGTAGQVLQMNAGASAPEWATTAAGVSSGFVIAMSIAL